MITSTNFIYSTALTCLSIFFVFQEVSVVYSHKNKINLESHLYRLSKELPFYSNTKKNDVLNKVIKEQESLPHTFFEHHHFYQLGKLKLALGLETSNIEDRISYLCEARGLFNSASKLSPNQIDYHIAIADIESISPYLSSTCQNNLGIHKKSNLVDINNTTNTNSSTNQISTQDRLKLIKNLSPTDPSTLYQIGLIKKNMGSRLEAMRDFRTFDENSLAPNSSEIILYLLSQVQTEEEMTEIIPRKLPNILNWLKIYKDNHLESKNFINTFETPLIETLEKIVESNNYNEVGGNEKQQLLNSLLKLYWSKDTQKFSTFKNKLNKLIYKEISLNGNDVSQQEIFKILSSSNRLPTLVSTKLSNISKKTSQVYNWNHYQEETALELTNKIEAIGLFIPSYQKANTLILQGGEGEQIPKDLSIEIWTSTDNISYNLSNTLTAKINTKIGSKTIALFTNAKINAPYVKIYFTYNEKTIKLNSPISLAFQIFETKNKI